MIRPRPGRLHAAVRSAAALLLLLPAIRVFAQAGGAPPAALPAGVTAVTSVEGIEEYRLDNGLRVLLFPEPSKQTMTVNITYLVGSRHENYGETGMAHLLEHLMFKGSERHTNVPQELTSHGAPAERFHLVRPHELLRDLRRVGSQPHLGARPRGRPDGEELHRPEGPRFRDDGGPQRDSRSGRTIRARWGWTAPSSTAYLWHNYGKSTIGARSDLEHVPIDRLQAFYRTWYQPDNAVLVVGGKLDRARTLASGRGEVRRHSAPVPPAAGPLHRGAGPGRRARGDPAPGGRHAGGRDRLPHSGRLASRLRAGRGPGPDPRRHPVGAFVQGAGRDRPGVVGLRAKRSSSTTRASPGSASSWGRTRVITDARDTARSASSSRWSAKPPDRRGSDPRPRVAPRRLGERHAQLGAGGGAA